MAARRTSGGAKTLASKRMPAMRMAMAAILARKRLRAGTGNVVNAKRSKKTHHSKTKLSWTIPRALPYVPGFLWPEFYIGHAIPEMHGTW